VSIEVYNGQKDFRKMWSSIHTYITLTLYKINVKCRKWSIVSYTYILVHTTQTHALFIAEGVAEVSQIFLGVTHVLP
jgi:hypothetical protein